MAEEEDVRPGKILVGYVESHNLDSWRRSQDNKMMTVLSVKV